jgi:hypothetical protein
MATMQARAAAGRPKRAKRDQPMTDPHALAGIAALSICESLLLALNDAKILPEKEIMGVLIDAAAAHAAPPIDGEAEMHAAVAALINAIIAGGNSVRRP